MSGFFAKLYGTVLQKLLACKNIVFSSRNFQCSAHFQIGSHPLSVADGMWIHTEKSNFVSTAAYQILHGVKNSLSAVDGNRVNAPRHFLGILIYGDHVSKTFQRRKCAGHPRGRHSEKQNKAVLIFFHWFLRNMGNDAKVHIVAFDLRKNAAERVLIPLSRNIVRFRKQYDLFMHFLFTLPFEGSIIFDNFCFVKAPFSLFFCRRRGLLPFPGDV